MITTMGSDPSKELQEFAAKEACSGAAVVCCWVSFGARRLGGTTSPRLPWVVARCVRTRACAERGGHSTERKQCCVVQEDVARDAVRRAAERGDWVCLKVSGRVWVTCAS